MENFSIVKVDTKLFDIDGEIFRLSHPIFEFFMILIFIFVHRENLDLILLSLHHFFVINKSISIGIVILEHPAEFEEIIEIIEDHLSSKSGIILSEHKVSGRFVIFSSFLGNSMIVLFVMIFLVESEFLVVMT
jgi:hypothetical protein